MKYKTIKDTLQHIEAYANSHRNSKVIAIHIVNEKDKIYEALVEFTDEVN